MTSNFWMLATPIFTFLAVLATSAFTFSRIVRYGRVFNWPPRPDDPRSNSVKRRTDP